MVRFFDDTHKLFLKFMQKAKKLKQLEQLKEFWKKKNKVGEISLPDFKTYYVAIVIKAVWYWWRNRQIDYAGIK